MNYTLVGYNAIDPQRIILRFQVCKPGAQARELALRDGATLARTWNSEQTAPDMCVDRLRCMGLEIEVTHE